MRNYFFSADDPLTEYRKSDFTFVASVILLFGLGLFSLFISSQQYAERMFGNPFYFVKRQLVSIALGFAGFVFFATLHIKRIRKVLPFVVLVALILCVLTFVPGISVERNGARRWIRLPLSFTLQPSEFAKFAIVLFLANLFDKQAAIQNPNEKSVLPAVIGIVVFSVLIVLQKDFSTAVFLFGIGIALFFVTGSKLAWFFPSLILIIPALVLLIVQEPYRIERIIAFLKPTEGLRTYNYQSIAAKRAISSGNIWGLGIGSALNFVHAIPEVQADYIFAGWAEAMGFVGVALYFLLLTVFSYRAFRIALHCKNRFAAFASFGFALVIFLQSLMNTAVVAGLLPTTGIPLPFFSLGGSSIVVTFLMCGFLVNTSRLTSDGDADENMVIKKGDEQ